MGHYDCKYCDASPGEEHSADCERFQPMTDPNHTDTSRSGDLVERLRALHVWPQAVADDHADILTPRQIDRLYEVGRVSHKAADRIEALEAENARLNAILSEMNDTDIIAKTMAENERLRETLAKIAALTRVRETRSHQSEWTQDVARAALGEKQ